MEGRSLVPAFANQPVVRAAPLFFEHDGSRAVRDGRWKLVSLVGDAWELYDMEADPAEMHNLITQLPDQAHTMMAAWNAWAKRCHVDPTTNPFGHGGAEAHEPANVSPQIANHPLVIRCDVATDAQSGVVLAQGGREYGYALHLSEGRPVFSVRIARELFVAKSAKAVSGHFSLEARLENDGKMKLFVNGELAATGQASGLIPTQPLDDLTVGEDEKSAVGDYAAPNPLNGKVDNVKITAE
jgi:arylsulfatase